LIVVATGLLVHAGRVLIQKRMPEGAWAGLWEFPGGRIEPGESPEQAVVREFMEETGLVVRVAEPLGLVRHGCAAYRVELHCFRLALAGRPRDPVLTAATAHLWAGQDDLDRLRFPAGHRKLMDRLAGEEAWRGIVG